MVSLAQACEEEPLASAHSGATSMSGTAVTLYIVMFVVYAS